jgi:hypothetical protein
MSAEISERAPTQDLAEMPVTLELLSAKLDHLILAVALIETTSERAAREAESAKTFALEARTAALNAAEHVLEARQSLEPLTRKERLGVIFGGAAAGGAFAWAALTVLGIGGIAAAISSCGH